MELTPDMNAVTEGYGLYHGLAKVHWTEWANYAAQDGDGDWYVYESEPEVSPSGYETWNNYVSGYRTGPVRYARVLITDPNPDWRNTLINLRD
jgi:hypothetical protein